MQLSRANRAAHRGTPTATEERGPSDHGPSPPAAVAPAGTALPDRVAYLEGSVDAAWEGLEGHFQRFRDTQAEIARIHDRLAQLTQMLQVLTAGIRKNRSAS